MDDTEETTDPVAAGIEQFQRAALDAVRAARAMLDAAETIVADPKAIEAVVSTIAGVARDATQTVAHFAASATSASSTATSDDADDDSGRGFETIDVD